MQYLSFTFATAALLSIANSSPILFEAATAKQALGIDPIPAKFGSDSAASNSYNPVNTNRTAYENNDIDTTYSVYRSDLQTLAKEIQGRASTQRTSSTSDYPGTAYRAAQSSCVAFKTAAKPTATVCAALKLIPASDQETAVKYVAFIQHTADNAYEHSIEGDGQSAYWDFCLIDDYMAAVSSYIENAGTYNGTSIGTQ